MNECRKIRRNFMLVTVWITFIIFTLYGCFTAYERTLYTLTKQETEKIYLTDLI